MDTYRQGMKRAGLYYGLAVLFTFCFHFLVGWDFKYAPPSSTIVFVICVIIGAVWAILNVVNLCTSPICKQRLGELTIHGVVVAFTALMLIFFVYH